MTFQAVHKNKISSSRHCVQIKALREELHCLVVHGQRPGRTEVGQL